jgi:phosphoglucosamine mutase
MSKAMKLFGTDGIRGAVNQTPMTPEIIQKVAMAAAQHLIENTKITGSAQHRPTVVIGKDTRLSGYMLESALVSGFVSMGVDVMLLGPLPTPAVAMLTRTLRAHLGVMISASHNPFKDNGIKFFDAQGFKLTNQNEKYIEELTFKNKFSLASAENFGKARRVDDALGRYNEFVKSSFPKGMRLDGLKIVVDCANGAAYKVAPQLLWELGADVIAIGNTPNGVNINLECGATHVVSLQNAVVEHQAHIGIALDGDADRLIVVDEKGQILDGDQIMALIAKLWLEQGILKGSGIVATHMSNLGLERFMASKGLQLFRSNVGDKYVLEMMQANGCNVGGEQSGHIILSDYTTTGDGLLAALQVLALMVAANMPASAIGHTFEPVPQILRNVRTQNMINLNDDRIRLMIDAANTCLDRMGRLLVRQSGTEPLIRIMAQGDDAKMLNDVVDNISGTIAALDVA